MLTLFLAGRILTLGSITSRWILDIRPSSGNWNLLKKLKTEAIELEPADSENYDKRRDSYYDNEKRGGKIHFIFVTLVLSLKSPVVWIVTVLCHCSAEVLPHFYHNLLTMFILHLSFWTSELCELTTVCYWGHRKCHKIVIVVWLLNSKIWTLIDLLN